jgi:DNA helicase-2/ATP-dependent DNA helicase PcrA
VFGDRNFGVASRFLAELPEDLVDQQGTDKQAATGWAAGAAPPPIQRRSGGPDIGTGDDVVHASFGAGTVTGVEPGGVLIVRFAGDGSERKLMADYAPIKKVEAA